MTSANESSASSPVQHENEVRRFMNKYPVLKSVYTGVAWSLIADIEMDLLSGDFSPTKIVASIKYFSDLSPDDSFTLYRKIFSDFWIPFK
jgi:hypothetical protein